MRYKNLIIILISFTVPMLGQNKITPNPITEFKINGFEKQDKTLITNLFSSSGWFTLSSWSKKTKNQGIDIIVKITRKSLNLIELQLSYNNNKIDTSHHNINKLYGRALATKIVNIIGNKIFGEEKFNSLASSKITFSGVNQYNQRNIYTIEIDNKNLSQITYQGNSLNPAWTKSKQHIFYNNQGDINNSLIIKNSQSGKHRLFAYFNGPNSQVEVNPINDKIALCSTINGTIDISIMNINNDNFEIHSLTNNEDIEFSPTWSPNGHNICYSSSSIKKGKLTLPKLKIINTTSKEIKDLFPQSKGGYYDPTWSQNGLIAYSKKVKRQFLIAYTDPLKNNTETIINIKNIPSGDWLTPSWAPDSRHLVCVNKKENDSRLYIIDSWLNTAKQIHLNISDIKDPVWSLFQ